MSEPQPELVCGSGADAFVIHDNAVLDARLTLRYNADGDSTKAVEQERWHSAFWSNPLSGKTVPYTQTDNITTVFAVPGDFDSATQTIVGENIYTDPVTHKKVLASTGRVVFGADGSLFRAGKQPFIDAFVDGDMSVFDAVLARRSRSARDRTCRCRPHRRPTGRPDRAGIRAGLAAVGELSRAGSPGHDPQRGVVAQAVRRARSQCPQGPLALPRSLPHVEVGLPAGGLRPAPARRAGAPAARCGAAPATQAWAPPRTPAAPRPPRPGR